MLERVPAAAESTAQLFLRSVENPVRSSRVLDPRFWRNGADNIESSNTSTWWASYLQQVRAVPPLGHLVHEDSLSLTTPYPPPWDIACRARRGRHDTTPRTPAKLGPRAKPNTPRAYSVSCSSQQSTGAKEIDEPADGYQTPYSPISRERRDFQKSSAGIEKASAERKSFKQSGDQKSKKRPQFAAYELGADYAIASKPATGLANTLELTPNTPNDRLGRELPSGARNEHGAKSQVHTSDRNPPNLTTSHTATRTDLEVMNQPLHVDVKIEGKPKAPKRQQIRAEQRNEPLGIEAHQTGHLEQSSEATDRVVLIKSDTPVPEGFKQPRTRPSSASSDPSTTGVVIDASIMSSPLSDLARDWDYKNPFSSLIPEAEVRATVEHVSTNMDKQLQQPVEKLALDEMHSPSFIAPVVSKTQQRRAQQALSGRSARKDAQTRDPKKASLDALMGVGDKATTQQFDEAWSVFLSMDGQQEAAPYIFRFLARSHDSKHLSRARAAFNIIQRTRRTGEMYKAAMYIELRRYQHGNAISLAFEATMRGSENFNVLPELLAYFVDKLLWNSAAELLHRNKSARREFLPLASVSEQREDAIEEMLPLSRLVESCKELPDLHTKTLSLFERTKSQDVAFTEHKDVLRTLCQRLAIQSVQSSAVLTSITPQALLSILQMEDEFGCLNLHREALYTISGRVNLVKRSDKLDLALIVYRNLRFKYPAYRPTNQSIMRLILLCAETGFHSNSLYDYLLDQFKGSPNPIAYHKIMTVCARQGKVESVERYFRSFIEKHGEPNRAAQMNPVLHAYAVNGDVSNTRKSFDRLREEYNIKADSVSWNMLMLAHVRSEDDISAFGIFREMQQEGIRPDQYTFGQLLAVCAAHSDTEAALDLLVDARDSNVEISVPMVNTVVEAYLKNDDVSSAFRFAMTTLNSGAKELLTRLWNSFIRYFAFKGRLNELMKTRNLMARSNVAADEMTYAAMVAALVSARRTSEAMEMLRAMREDENIVITKFHYSIILHGFIAEGNKDMAALIENEVKQQYPDITADVDTVISTFDARSKDGGDPFNSNDETSRLEVLAEVLRRQSQPKAVSDSVSSISGKSADVESICYETIVRALIRSRSHASAERVIKSVPSLRAPDQEEASVESASQEMLLAQLDIALERENWAKFDQIWGQVFERAIKINRPIANSRRVHNDGPGMSPIIAKSSLGRFSLGSVLGRYMEAMARQKRHHDMQTFFKTKLWPSGFELTGRNWNKYIQVLCRSDRSIDQTTAFKLFERVMRTRAQSWKLLKRGEMRKKLTTYAWEPYGQLSRPILQKQSSFRIVERADELRQHPERKIPTYLTTVHLANVLMQAHFKVQQGYRRQFDFIRMLAPRTKKFIQYMPHLKDDVQGSILRHISTQNETKHKRTRSEQSLRGKVSLGGLSGGQSPLDHVPLDLLEEIEEIAGRSNDVRRLLKDRTAGDDRIMEKSEVQLGEMFTGQISRAPIVLAGKPRFESSLEMDHRIAKEEREREVSTSQTRADLKTRQLTGNVHLMPPSAKLVPDHDENQTHVSAEREGLTTGTRSGKVEQTTARATGAAESTGNSIGQSSVLQQLEELNYRREQVAKKDRTQGGSGIPRLAIPYANLRRVRRRLALRQRIEAREILTQFGDNISPRGHQVRTEAGKRIEVHELARARRAAVIAYERDLKAGKRLDPFPKTGRGLRSRVMFHGSAKVRLVPDLGRNQKNFMVRRGRLFDKRQRRVQTSPSKDNGVPEEVIKRSGTKNTARNSYVGI